VSDHRHEYPVRISCRALEVSPSGFYRWLNAAPSRREAENAELLRDIEKVHLASRKTYGSPRVHAQLCGMGWECGRSRIERLMRLNGIRSRLKRKYRVTTDSKHSERIAPNLLERNFNVQEPNKAWVSDVTFLWTREGWLYLAVILDLFSRRVVGWSMSDRLTTGLVLGALDAALSTRKVINGLIHHSDRGKEYASQEFRDRLYKLGIRQSMSREADCWDNAVAESFFHTLKAELGGIYCWKTRQEARTAVFEWIEVFYNRQRLHSTLGYVAPAVYEQEVA
jgi:putative transposase